MARPSDESVSAFLRERGAPQHLVRGGAAGLIAGWRAFVTQVERGYPLGLEDYRNDLDLRTLIELAGLGPEVAGEDERLRCMLIATDRAVWSGDAPSAFWVAGYPSNASGQLLADLKAESLLR